MNAILQRMKRCRECNEFKSLSEFYEDKLHKDGLRSNCKECQNDMSWDNYGKWHIDHIIPRSFFVYNSPGDVEFKMCWRLENLQPLWASDNIRKGNKLKSSA